MKSSSIRIQRLCSATISITAVTSCSGRPLLSCKVSYRSAPAFCILSQASAYILLSLASAMILFDVSYDLVDLLLVLGYVHSALKTVVYKVLEE